MSGALETEDRELAAWRAEWQQLEGEETRAADLAARACAVETASKRVALREGAGGLFALALCGFLAMRVRGEPVAMVGILGTAAYIGAHLYRFFSRFFSQATLEAAELRSDLDAWALVLRRTYTADVKRLVEVRRWTALGAGALVPWSVYFFLTHAERLARDPWRIPVAYAVCVVAVGGALLRNGQLLRRAHKRSETFERHYPLG
jgi:hypothetical protein